MSREIKFRAWDGESEEMIYLENSGLQYFDFEGSYSLGFTVGGYEGFWAHEQYDSPTEEASKFPIMQYTGLKDKKGREIYEGDVIPIKFSNRSSGIKYGEDYTINGVVKFDDSFQLRYILEFKKNNYDIISCEFGYGAMTELEIIGNIHENPELL